MGWFRGSPTALLLGLALAAGCPSSPRLTVRVQSDLAAGHEVRQLTSAVYVGSGACPPSGLRSVGGSSVAVTEADAARLSSGLTVGEVEVDAGTYTVHVTANVGGRVLDRCVLTNVVGSRVVRVPLAIGCLDVSCPAAGGDPSFTQCLNGRCVHPECDPDDASTTERCCDRSALGDACDEDPTLCSDAPDCGGALECRGAPRCEEGVCFEGADRCPPGERCSFEARACVPATPRDDAGTRDAGGADAASDAYFVPGEDAPLPDAFVPTGLEDCTLEGDEDLNGAADCDDPACASEIICTDPRGCEPLRGPAGIPVEPIPTPTHWYRSDQQVIAGSLGRVCAWRDLVGERPFLSISPPRLTAGALDMHVAEMRAMGDLGLDVDGGYTVFVAWRTDAASVGSPLLVSRAWAGAPSLPTFFFNSFQGAEARVRVRDGALYTVGPQDMGVQVMTVVAGPLREGIEVASVVSHALNGSPLVPASAAGGPDTAGSDVFAGEPETHIGSGHLFSMLEIVVYDRALLVDERAQVESYLAARYRP